MTWGIWAAFSGILMGAALLAGTAQAATFTPTGPTTADSGVVVDVDLMANPGTIGFDLFLNIPVDLFWTTIVDDASDDGLALFQVYTDTGLSGGTANGAAVNGNAIQGVRVSDFSGGTQGFTVFDLTFLTSSSVLKDQIVEYSYTLFDASGGSTTENDTFTIQIVDPNMTPIPLPAGGILMLSGLGALVAVPRRRVKQA